MGAGSVGAGLAEGSGTLGAGTPFSSGEGGVTGSIGGLSAGGILIPLFIINV